MMEELLDEYEGNISWTDNGDLCIETETGAIFTFELPSDKKFLLPASITVMHNSTSIKFMFEFVKDIA